MLLEDFSFQLINISCLPSSTLFNALVELDNDVSPAMPFLNAVIVGAHYRHSESVLDFMHGSHIVTLLPRQMKVTGLADEEEASRVLTELQARINDAWDRRRSIEPATTTIRPPPAIELLRLLPRTNCGRCGVPTCLAFAANLSRGIAAVEECPELDDGPRGELMARVSGAQRSH